VIPPAARTDTTPQAGNHPGDHNDIATALNDVVAKIGTVDTAIAGRVAKAGDTMTSTLILDTAGYGIQQPAGTDGMANGGLITRGDGVIRILTNVANTANIRCGRGQGSGTIDPGQTYISFIRGLSPTGTTIGSINIATSTSVSYATTSDKRLKTLTRPVDPDEAVATIAATEPVNFIFTGHPEDGEQVGFFAQDLVTYAPEAVTPGTGEPDDAEFTPWMVDLAKLVPTLVAAVQALTRRIQALEEAQP
jgi:Chaperone of endosialidase